MRERSCCLPLTLIVTACLVGSPAQAIPPTVHYQGNLSEEDGSPVAGAVDLTMSIWDGPGPGASPLWSESHSATPVIDGAFAVELGSIEPFGPAFDSSTEIWLQVTVDAETLAPRQHITSSFYSLRSLHATQAGIADDSRLLDGATRLDLLTDAQSGMLSPSHLDAHTFAAGSHHAKTTSFSDLLDQATLAQLPDGSATDAELESRILLHGHDSAYYTRSAVDALLGTRDDAISTLENELALLKAQLGTLSQLAAAVTVSGGTVRFDGVNLQITNGSGSTDGSPNTLGNLILGYNENDNGATRTGSHNLVVGINHEYTSYSGVVAGEANTISGVSASVIGGSENDASGAYSSVSGGKFNEASGNNASVAGGWANDASGDHANVSGGSQNEARGSASSVSGGSENIAAGTTTSVAGGTTNTATAQGSSIAGGRWNNTTGFGSSVAGGARNTAAGSSASVSGGRDNEATGNYSNISGGDARTATGTTDYDAAPLGSVGALLAGVSRAGNLLTFSGMNVQIVSGSGTTEGTVNGLGNLIVGYNENAYSAVRGGSHNLVVGIDHEYTSYGGVVAGERNTVGNKFASVTGGRANHATGEYSTVSGGSSNQAGGSSSNVSGGHANWASAVNSSITGGEFNRASAEHSSVSGGRSNEASGEYSIVSGGDSNQAGGSRSAVSGGRNNAADGWYSLVAGGRNNRTDASSSTIHGGKHQQPLSP